LFTKWGKTGAKKKYYKQTPVTGEQKAIAAFAEKFKAQTGNNWADRYNFSKKPNKYNFVELSRGKDEQIIQSIGTDEKVKCTLEPRLKDLVELIWDQNTVMDYMKSQDIDLKKMPLGNLSGESLKKGYGVLQEIQSILQDSKRETDQGTSNSAVLQAKLKDASTRFHSIIPTTSPSVISTIESVNAKIEMLNVLIDIALAQNLLKKTGKQRGGRLHPLDDKYEKLTTKLTPVEKNSKSFKIISTYLNNTASKMNKPTILEIFEMDREGERERFGDHKDLKNRKLLWHGTNIAVVVAICATGLRIMSHSGGRVGSGIYFAAENGKSASYVRGDKNGTSIMFLAEVALGKEHHIMQDDSSLKSPPSGFDSIIAQGRTDPDPSGDETLKLDGHQVTVPAGKPHNRAKFKDSRFLHTEYLVYKESQVRLRYLLKLKF